jgi:hypothetical protein
VAVVLIAASGAFIAFGRGIWYPLLLQIRGPRSVADVLAKFGPDARARLKPHFQRAGVAYPPKELAILGFKAEKRVALWARNGGEWRFIRDYPVLAASGHAGPKLREGDQQVPEGVYRIHGSSPTPRSTSEEWKRRCGCLSSARCSTASTMSRKATARTTSCAA